MMKQRTVTVGFLGLVVFFASSAFATQHRPHHAQKPAQITAPAPAPPIPSVPARESAVPPQVSYENGQLLIDAKNSTLRDILTAVEKNTGATFDISSGDTSERVVGRLGPGPARDVMTDLLNGSHFNYVMLSPANDPSALSRVVLTARGSAPPQAGGQNEAPQFPPQFQPQQGMPNSVAAQVQPQDPNAPDANQDNAENTDDPNADSPDPAEEAQPDQSAQQEGVKIQQQQLRPGTIVQPQQNQ